MIKYVLIISAFLLSACQTTGDVAYLGMINTASNQGFEYQGETKGQDTWKTVEEFVNDRGGDCEDFSIYKCELLTEKVRDLKILVAVERKNPSIAHAVLLIDGVHVLDNNHNEVYPISKFKEKYHTVVTLHDCGREAIKTLKGTVARVGDARDGQ